MITRILTWPGLIAVAVAVIGVGLAMHSIAGWVAHSYGSFHGGGVMGSLSAVGAVACLCLSFALYAGRDWARRILVVLAFCFALGTALLSAADVIRESQFSGHGPPTAEMLFEGRLLTIMHVGLALCGITPAVFITFVLLHRDVAQSFQRSRTERHGKNI